MQVSKIKQSTPSFKQIKLTTQEIEKCKTGFNAVLLKPFDFNNKNIFFNMLKSHLNNEVELKKYSSKDDRRVFSVNLYLKFFELLDVIKSKIGTFDNFLEELNNFSENFVINNTLKEREEYLDFNVSKVDEIVEDTYSYLGLSKDKFIEKAQFYPILQYSTGDSISKNVSIVTKALGFEKEEYIQFFNSNPRALTYPASIILSKAQTTMGILKIHDLEEFKKIVKSNPDLLTFKDLKSQINSICEFLNSDETTIIDIIKRKNTILATSKMEKIKTNFYTMKDYLKVDNEKMKEIALNSSVLLTKKPVINIRSIEELANKLNILPVTFIKKANNYPTIYSMTANKLENNIEFISNKLGFTREEAIKYISENLNILSYPLNRINDRTEKNYEILNRYLGINEDTYISILKEYSFIMGEKTEVLKDKLKAFAKYFNINQELHSNMVLKNPRIITKDIADINKIISASSFKLKIDKDEYKQMCIKEPLLLTRFSTFHEIDIPHNASLLGVSNKEYIELGRKNPTLLSKRFQDIEEIKQVLQPNT